MNLGSCILSIVRIMIDISKNNNEIVIKHTKIQSLISQEKHRNTVHNKVL